VLKSRVVAESLFQALNARATDEATGFHIGLYLGSDFWEQWLPLRS
jgi:hypothetical protein